MRRRANRRDTTHTEIVTGLRSLGWRVWEIDGAVDLAVCVGSSVYLVDCKTPKSSTGRVTLTDTQAAMIADGWPLILATSAQHAADQIAALRAAGRMT